MRTENTLEHIKNAEIHYEYVGNTLNTPWTDFEHISRPLKVYIKNTLKRPWHGHNTSRIHSNHTRNALNIFGSTLNEYWTYVENTEKRFGNTSRLPWPYLENTAIMLWECNENTLRIHWTHFKNTDMPWEYLKNSWIMP